MEAAPFIVYVIIMLFVGISQYQKKQKDAQRRSAGPHTPKFPPGFPPMEPQMSKPVRPDVSKPGQAPGTPAGTGGRTLLQGPQALGTGKPVKHPIDLQKTYNEQQLKSGSEQPYAEGLAEVPEIVPPAREVPQVTETAQAQQFWNKYDGVQQVDPVVQGSNKRQPAQLPELTPKSLAQGIILAEILQPPRAIRPYRPVHGDRDK